MNKFNDIIKARRSVRAFIDKKVEREKLLRILGDAIAAPSAKNIQPWYFVVAENDVAIKIADIMAEKLCARVAADPAFRAGSVAQTAEIVRRAPVFIAVFDVSGGILPPAPIQQSIGAAIENLCLSAENEGLGSLWILDIFDCAEEIGALLGENGRGRRLAAGVAIGYAAPNLPPRSGRRALGETVRFLDNE